MKDIKELKKTWEDKVINEKLILDFNYSELNSDNIKQDIFALSITDAEHGYPNTIGITMKQVNEIINQLVEMIGYVNRFEKDSKLKERKDSLRREINELESLLLNKKKELNKNVVFEVVEIGGCWDVDFQIGGRYTIEFLIETFQILWDLCIPRDWDFSSAKQLNFFIGKYIPKKQNIKFRLVE